ncbi:hypothetical protein LPAF129_13610 [Ligilactobacillus pabuli]|uniref:Phage shock protein PspC N-terminal domain-containing protein n=1 Tax=Ligilactobacillus pabuli TaxID=2886039 RepID=A0ABQ5JLK6_9LACO|nr:PspC domain-containing protein [Ligilactobacillus pabuli]GKS81675.1 hypothetical protein LPAF129_13610 [Ligilactobacillus pabuli]HIW89869.1 PspC domain-containing protein [Candidatus Ligilactobacillus excrementipullorum]
MAKKRKQLVKSNDRVVSGVFGGIAEYFDWDKTIVRIVGAFLIIFPGNVVGGILLYVLAAMIMPDDHQDHDQRDDDSFVEGEFREK